MRPGIVLSFGDVAPPVAARDCRDCTHNSYRKLNETNFVSCSHPVTLAKEPRWEAGDPAIVNWRTADVHVRELWQLQDCPTWEPARNTEVV